MGRRLGRGARMAIARSRGRMLAYEEARSILSREPSAQFHAALARSEAAEKQLMHIIEQELPAIRQELREIFE